MNLQIKNIHIKKIIININQLDKIIGSQMIFQTQVKNSHNKEKIIINHLNKTITTDNYHNKSITFQLQEINNSLHLLLIHQIKMIIQTNFKKIKNEKLQTVTLYQLQNKLLEVKLHTQLMSSTSILLTIQILLYSKMINLNMNH